MINFRHHHILPRSPNEHGPLVASPKDDGAKLGLRGCHPAYELWLLEVKSQPDMLPHYDKTSCVEWGLEKTVSAH